ncbi:Transposable element Tc3 transposase [Anthophora plagiata]
MENYTIEQRIEIVKIHYKNGENFATTVRKIRMSFGHHNAPSRNTVINLIKKFEISGSVLTTKSSGRPRIGRSKVNIAAVSASVDESPSISIRHRAQQLNISRCSVQRILTKDLHLHGCKIQLTQHLHPEDHVQRRTFSNWILEHQQIDGDFSKKIIFSDEAHFQLGDYVNKQNCRIWGTENLQMIQQLPMHPPRVTVWCGFWVRGVIGPYFFDNDVGNAVTVTGIRYRDMITNFLWKELNGMDLEDIFFQQDGATCHTAAETMQLFQTKFYGRVISRHGDVNWPPRSCTLTPLDFFLWGFLKGKVYANNPQTIPELKEVIGRTITEISPQMCHNVIENFNKRINVCQQGRGGHLSDIVFHT